ncbi:uncharacterized protein LOC143580118 [Bidens hawaiensis]|uniref:uncharacterized protein LOC143580118 n=1 Tax=Bidens hawaiensis TaxID=980011 RepID=UPI0040490BDD
MLQTLNPYTPTAKTAEIMARYRPIAPKPAGSSGGGGGSTGVDDGSGSGSGSGSSLPSMSPTIRQSPYLRNIWPHLQSRPTRTRKRGRTSLGPPPTSFKRPRTLLQGLSPPFHVTSSPARTLAIQSFAPTTTATFVTLPLLQPHHMQTHPDAIDLNKTVEIPEEKDLLAQLQKPPAAAVISPKPIRLIPSTLSIKAIKPNNIPVSEVSMMRTSEDIERELESLAVPAFVSDSNNQVRLVNSSYQAMLGQPECGWVQSMAATCNSICGNVVIKFMDLEDEEVMKAGFSCLARVEWGTNGKKNVSVNAFCEVVKLACESKDYKFAWRFHTRQASENLQDQETSQSVNLKRNS